MVNLAVSSVKARLRVAKQGGSEPVAVWFVGLTRRNLLDGLQNEKKSVLACVDDGSAIHLPRLAR